MSNMSWKRIDSIITISYLNRKIELTQQQCNFIINTLNLVVAYDLNVLSSL